MRRWRGWTKRPRSKDRADEYRQKLLETVAEAHREWYAAHPDFVAAAITRIAPLLHRWRAA